MSNIVPALVSAFITLVVCLINNAVTLNKSREELKQHNLEVQAIHNQSLALLEEKLSTLSKNVEKHNQVVERVYALEKQTEVQEEKIRVANHRIEDLEKAVG